MIRERKRTARTAPSASYSGALLSVAERIGANRRARLAAWFEAQRLGVRLSMVLGMCAVVLLIGFAGVASVDYISRMSPVERFDTPPRDQVVDHVVRAIDINAELSYPTPTGLPELTLLEEHQVTVPPGQIFAGPLRGIQSKVYNYLASEESASKQLEVALNWVQRVNIRASEIGVATHRLANPQLFKGANFTVLSMVETDPSAANRSDNKPANKPRPLWLNPGDYSFAANYTLKGIFSRVGGYDVGVWNVFGVLDRSPSEKAKITVRVPVMLPGGAVELALRHVGRSIKEAEIAKQLASDTPERSANANDKPEIAMGQSFEELGFYRLEPIGDGRTYVSPEFSNLARGTELLLEIKISHSNVAGLSSTGRDVMVGN